MKDRKLGPLSAEGRLPPSLTLGDVSAVDGGMTPRTRLSDEDLPGYRVVERIYHGNETEVYRGFQVASRRKVMIKVLASDYPSPDQVAKLTHEHEVARTLDIDGVVKVIALER